MEYANVSVRFPRELDTEIERFIEETGVYTNKSEFVKEACRAHLRQLNDEPALAALRLERLLARAEASGLDEGAIGDRLDELGEKVDAESVERATREAREDVGES
jgi:Arc/MetJ-type ribon-helix-helix transcriptional regulator